MLLRYLEVNVTERWRKEGKEGKKKKDFSFAELLPK